MYVYSIFKDRGKGEKGKGNELMIDGFEGVRLRRRGRRRRGRRRKRKSKNEKHGRKE